MDRDLRHAQMADQLVEMPEFVQFASQQQRAEQIVDIPVRGGGRQGFRPGQVATASASLPRSAHEAVEGVFRTFPRFHKSAESGQQVSAEITRQVDYFTLGAHQMAHAGVAAHSSSWTPAAYEPEESLPEEEEEDPDRWVDEHRRTWWRSCEVPGRWYHLKPGHSFFELLVLASLALVSTQQATETCGRIS